MIRKLKRALCVLVLVCFLAPMTAHAFVPLAIATYLFGQELAGWALASAAIHLAGLGGYIAYNMYGNRTSVNPATNQINRDAKVTWVDIQDNVPTVMEANVPVTFPMDALVSAAEQDKNKYPMTYNASHKPDYYTTAQNLGSPTTPYFAGDKIKNSANGHYYQLTSMKRADAWAFWGVSYPSPLVSGFYDSNTTIGIKAVGGQAMNGGTLTYKFQTQYWYYTDLGTQEPPMKTRTPAETVVELNKNDSGVPQGASDMDGNPAVFTDKYGAEIDDFIHNNPNIMSPSEPLPTPATDSQITNARNQASAADLAARAAEAKAAWEAAAAAAAADPGNAALAAAAAAAKAAYDAAAAAAAAAASQAGNSQDQQNYRAPTVPGAPSRKSLNLDKFRDLAHGFENIGPYPLVSTIAGYYNQLVADPSPPSFDLPVWGNTVHVDLTPFDPLAKIVRWFLALFLTVGGILYAIRFWRGVS